MINLPKNNCVLKQACRQAKVCWLFCRGKRMIRERVGKGPLPRVIDYPPTHFPNIEQKLNQINYYDAVLNQVEIGCGSDEQIRSKLKLLEKTISKSFKLEDDDVIEVDYHKLARLWSITEDGRQKVVDLANHYGIFRDLFPAPPQPVPKNPLEAIPPPPVYCFSPLVQLHCEFCIQNSEVVHGEEFYIETSSSEDGQKEGEVTSMPVFRGNLVMPKYCVHPPNVLIDATAFNGLDSISGDQGNFVESNLQSIYDDKSSGGVKLIGDDEKYFTLALVNLDSLTGQETNCHWMVANIHNDKNSKTHSDIVFDYLPVYGVKGLGYHRYVFVLFKHDAPISLDKVADYDLESRKFNAFKFINEHEGDRLTPVGLSWFQSKWDYSCQKVFWEKLNMRSPVYGYFLPKPPLRKQDQFPHGAPFNVYLDHYRDPKEISKEVLLERISSVDLFNYSEQFKPKETPPNIYKIAEETPDWTKSNIRKRRFKLGNFRGLRPHSAVEPLDNNADLDRPHWPLYPTKMHPINFPLHYPEPVRRPTPLRLTKWVLPPNEHPTYRLEHEYNIPKEDLKKLGKGEE